MSRVVVLHAGYGCETGCCGHIIEVDGEETGNFHFRHPYVSPLTDEAKLAFARDLVLEELGEEHVADLVWEECRIYDD